MNTDILWNNFLDKIKDRISPLSYDTWFKDTKLYKIDKSTAIIEVPMILHKKHLEENYLDEIEEIFNSITGTNFNFKFKLESELLDEEKNIKIIEMENTLESDLAKNNLIPDDLSVKYLSSNNGYQIAKYPKCKTELANELINNEIELSNWHVIKEIIDEFGDN